MVPGFKNSKEAIKYMEDCKHDYQEAVKTVLEYAKEEGLKIADNSDVRVARAFLEGIEKGRRKK